MSKLIGLLFVILLAGCAASTDIVTDSDSQSNDDIDGTDKPTITCSDVAPCIKDNLSNIYVCPEGSDTDKSCLSVSACSDIGSVVCASESEACVLQGCSDSDCISLDTDPAVIICTQQ